MLDLETDAGLLASGCAVVMPLHGIEAVGDTSAADYVGNLISVDDE
ncbi:MAG TPA: hypothetical protein VGS97_24770 [Actinocrinis sp.]|nr:hypothetical protein [Actinocrinis sp.]HEV2347331.1 hypothetical protein [Actinocrinis sp.]